MRDFPLNLQGGSGRTSISTVPFHPRARAMMQAQAKAVLLFPTNAEGPTHNRAGRSPPYDRGRVDALAVLKPRVIRHGRFSCVHFNG